MPILSSTRSGRKKDPEKENNKQEVKTSKRATKNTETGKELKENNSEGKKSRKPKPKSVMANEEELKTSNTDNTENENPTAAKPNIEETPNVPNVEQQIVDAKCGSPMDISAEDHIESNTDTTPPKKQKLENEQEKEEKPSQISEKETAVASNEEHKNLTSGFSLKSQGAKVNEEEESCSNMPEQLLTVISNLYLNVGKRLRLDFHPRCLDDLAFCHRHHYHSDLPEAPIQTQARSLRSALDNYRYVSFINSTTDMVHRGEFPGKGIFMKIMELVLSINYSTKHQNIVTFQQSYHKAVELFSMIVRTFPPCWHKLRTYYVGFLECGLDQAKLGNVKKDEPLSKSNKIFDIILDLLEDVLKTAEPDELKNSKSDTLQKPNVPQSNASHLTSPQNSMDLSVCNDIWNQNEYEERERQKQTFTALPMDQKIERIFMCLRLLLEILEYDMAMWILHHFKKTKEWIFCNDNRPLIVVLCELTQYTRMTRVARRIFSVYSESANKGLCQERLQVLERYISLLMMASNTADMENTAIGVKYPYLGEQTKNLIKEFFKIFKVHNREEISKYMETIHLLRIPYVRYEFIDNVLFTNTEPLTPQKIAIDIAKKRWLKYKPQSELSKADEDISREQYLHLLLDALREYCDWHGTKTFLHIITDYDKISPLSTTTDSVHRYPTNGNGVLVLKKIAKDIKKLESQLRMTVRMSKPKVNISQADICIDEAIIVKYRNDLKFLISLQNVVLKQKETYPEVDFSEWLDYLSNFPAKKMVKEEPPTQ
ncbi:uncharacterized protein [Musca autumnalis]|uniref:uncharacterized protein n=1 Tax=Musca autumnalis TaxID=221902 RepID=UPI003CF2E4C4